MSERPLTNPPTCTCQYLTVGNRLTTHNAVDSSRCEVHGPLSALRPPTPSVQATQEPPESALPCNLTGLTDDELIGLVLNVPDGPTDVEVRQIIEHVRDTEAEEWRKIVSAQRVNAYAAGQRMGQESPAVLMSHVARLRSVLTRARNETPPNLFSDALEEDILRVLKDTTLEEQRTEQERPDPLLRTDGTRVGDQPVQNADGSTTYSRAPLAHPPSDVSPAYCPYCPHCHPRTAKETTACSHPSPTSIDGYDETKAWWCDTCGALSWATDAGRPGSWTVPARVLRMADAMIAASADAALLDEIERRLLNGEGPEESLVTSAQCRGFIAWLRSLRTPHPKTEEKK